MSVTTGVSQWFRLAKPPTSAVRPISVQFGPSLLSGRLRATYRSCHFRAAPGREHHSRLTRCQRRHEIAARLAVAVAVDRAAVNVANHTWRVVNRTDGTSLTVLDPME
jgi:hypothetical protein